MKQQRNFSRVTDGDTVPAAVQSGLSQSDAIRQAVALLSGALGDRSAYGISVRAVWDRWYASEGRYLSSARDLRGRWRRLCPLLGDLDVAQCDLDCVDQYTTQRLATLTRRRLPPTPATLNRERQALHHALRWAVGRRLIPANPLDGLRALPERNLQPTRIRCDDDLAPILDELSPLMRLLVLLLYDPGMRRMEAVALQWRELHDDGDRFVVELCGDRTKAGVSRRVRLTARATEALRLWRLDHPDDAYVFQSPVTDSHYSPRWLYTQFQRACRTAHVDGMTFHQLRHAFAYVWRRQYHVPQAVVQRQGGWATASAFARYGITDDDELDEWSDVVDERIGPKKARP